MRDGALTMLTYMELNDFDYNSISEKMGAYQKWVAKVQKKEDKLVNVLTEPKFNIPSGDPYTGGWCRPQNDGPALRANSMVEWATVLYKNNQDYKSVFALISTDMGWVNSNWDK